MSNKVLKVEVNLASRVCTISDSEGTVLLSKPIKKDGYNKASIVEKLGKVKEIMTYTPEAKLPNADMTVYEALKELDDINKTNYGKEYLKIVVDRIPYQSPGRDEPILEKMLRKITGRRLESEASYLQRAREIKAEQFSKLGLSIAYNEIEQIENSTELSREEKSVAIAIINRQISHNGVKNEDLTKTVEVVEDDIHEVSAEELQRMREEAEREAEAKRVAEEAKKTEEAEKARKEAEEAEKAKIEQQPKPEEPKVQEEHTDDDNKGSGGAEDKTPKGEAPKAGKSQPKAKNKKRKIEGIKAGREAYRQRLQAGKTKKTDRPEGAPAPKRETKNERKARLAREADEQRKASAGKKPVSQKSKPKAEPTPKSEVEPNKKKEIRQVKVQLEDLKVRFTRKLKDASDSIRNKVYKPHRKGFKIAGVTALATLLLFAGVKTYNHFNDVEVKGQMADTTSLVQLLEGEKEIDIGDAIIKPTTELSASLEKESTSLAGTQTETNGGVQGVQTQIQAGTKTPEAVKPEEQGQVETGEPSSNYLSSYRGETTINLDSDRYYEAPNGTGDYGNFGNYKDCKKEMNKIGLHVKGEYTVIGTPLIVENEDGTVERYIQIKTEGGEGDLVIEADKVDLAEFIVRQNYPDAQYMAIHFEAEHENKDRTTLGWVKVDFAEKDLDNTRNQVEHEELER